MKCDEGYLPIIIAVSIWSGVPCYVCAAPPAPSNQPKPALKVVEKASEHDQRTVPKPGKPEGEQPPPDVIGNTTQIPSVDNKRQSLTKKLVKLKKHLNSQQVTVH